MGGRTSGRGGRGVAVLVSAFLTAGALISVAPATAANRFLTKKKAVKLFYPRAEADARFYPRAEADTTFLDTGEKASDSDRLDGQDSAAFLAAGGKAADADKLDGKNSTAFQDRCENGAIQGWAEVPASLGSSYTNLTSSFNCTGFQTQGRKSGTGVYLIDFGGIDSGSCEPRVASATIALTGGIPSVGFAFVQTVSDDESGPGLRCVARVFTTDENLVQENKSFIIVLHSPTPFTFIPPPFP